MTGDLRIRPGDLDDPRITALLATHLQAARETTPLCRAFALDVDGLRAPDIAFLSAWRGDELLGVGALRDLGGGHGEIKSMHTAAAARGRGVGRAMLQALVESARQRGMRRISLETGTMDYFAPARALYAACGFAACAAFGDYTDDPSNMFMTLTLDEAA
jgi:putative acetyltransferase